VCTFGPKPPPRQARPNGTDRDARQQAAWCRLLNLLADDQQAYTIAELKQLGLGGPTFIYKGIAAGRLRAVKKGRHTVILEPDLHAWMRGLPPTEVWQPTPTPQPDLKRRVRHLASIEAPGDRRHYRVIPSTLASKRITRAGIKQPRRKPFWRMDSRMGRNTLSQ
jgi:excisionase family DNA binding protein